MNLLPKETFIYDEIPAEELERTFDLVTFYNEVDVGLTLAHFNSIKVLRAFVPVATYHSEESDSTQTEFVSMVEGTYMPFFGFAYNLNKIQNGFHALTSSDEHARVDHSRFAIQHAQHIANMLVDEARLSSNMFEWTNEEQRRILGPNYDPVTVTLPNPDARDTYTSKDYYRSELYLF